MSLGFQLDRFAELVPTCQAIDNLTATPIPICSTILTRTVLDESYYYRIRMHAAESLLRVFITSMASGIVSLTNYDAVPHDGRRLSIDRVLSPSQGLSNSILHIGIGKCYCPRPKKRARSYAQTSKLLITSMSWRFLTFKRRQS
jgi:hypothetical protein